MQYKNVRHNHWFVFIIILLVLSLMWFLIDIKNTRSIQSVTAVENKIAEPLADKLPIELLDQLQNKLVISEAELAQTKPFASTIVAQ